MGFLALIQELGKLVILLFYGLIVLVILGLFESLLSHSFTWEMFALELPHGGASLGTVSIDFDTMGERELLDLAFLMALHLDVGHFPTLVLIPVVSHEVGIGMLSLLFTLLHTLLSTLKDSLIVRLLGSLFISLYDHLISIHSLQFGLRLCLNGSEMVGLTLGF